MAKKSDARRAVKLNDSTTKSVLEFQSKEEWLHLLSFNQLVHLLIQDGLKANVLGKRGSLKKSACEVV